MEDLPLKRTAETFKDIPEDPVKVADIDTEQLMANIPKDINTLTVPQSIALFSKNLKNLISIHSNELLLNKYQQSLNNGDPALDLNVGFSLDSITDSSETSDSSLITIPSPSSEYDSPPKKLMKIEKKSDPQNQRFKENTPDYDADDSSEPSDEILASEKSETDKEKKPTSNKRKQNDLLIKRFYLKSKPSLDITGYLSRIQDYSSLSVSVYLSASYYIHKLSILLKMFPITELNAYRLILSSLRVSCKLIEDINYSQKHFARVGGVSVRELSRVEIGFLFLCDFNLIISEEILCQHLSDINYLHKFLNDVPAEDK